MEHAETNNTLTLNEANFQSEVYDFDGVVLVDFWAPWCPPCHIMAPRVEELATKHKDNPKVKVGSIDVDQNQEISMNLQVMSLPTFKLFRNGEFIDETIGAGPIEQLDEMITRALPKAAAAA